jgi:nitrogen regulatory protein PII
MKQIVAVLKPHQMERVLEALKNESLEACTVHAVKGFGRQKSYLSEYQGGEYSLAYIPKVQLTAWVDEDRVQAVEKIISETARSGRLGDGKIFTLPLGESISIEPPLDEDEEA